MTRVKICGIRSQEDSEAAVTAGAQMLGFNFWPGSKRFLHPEDAAPITSSIAPEITRVGLFVDASEDTVRDTLAVCSLDLLQFHGDETPAYCRQFGRPFMKAFRLRDEKTLDCVGDYLDAPDQPYLIDAYVPGVAGGSGRMIPLELARLARSKGDCMVLAGGLTPENVGQAVHAIRPWAVDVASGVESAPGTKAPEQIAHFVAEVRRVDAS